MRPLLNLAILAAAMTLTGCLRSDAPPPIIIEPAPAATQAAMTGEALPMRLGGVAASDLLRLEVLHYAGDGAVRRDEALRWSDAPAAILRRRLESASAVHGIALQDRPDLPLVDATVERFGIAGQGALQLAAAVHLRCRMTDGSFRIADVAVNLPLTTAQAGDLATASGAMLDRLTADIWKQARVWQGR